MIYRTPRSLVLYGASVILAHLASIAGAAPDPQTLIEGVLSSRQQIPPLSLKLRYYERNPVGSQTLDYEVLMDGERRRYWQLTGNPQLRQMFTGKEVYTYDGSSTVAVDDLHEGTTFFIDLRILGLTYRLARDYRLESAMMLSLFDSGSFKLVSASTHSAATSIWNVEVTLRPGYYIDFWIDERRSFRVLKVEYSNTDNPDGHRVLTDAVTNEYNDSITKWLPTATTVSSFDANGSVYLQKVVQILEETEDFDPPGESGWDLEFLLSGLELPTWVRVVDARTIAALGNWRQDVKQLGPDDPWVPAPPPVLRSRRVSAFLVFLIVLTLPVLLLRKKALR